MEAGQPDTAKRKTESTAQRGGPIPPATSSPGQQELHMTKMVHLFGGDATTAARSKELLGGKGSNLAEMASLGLPVPPGFTITPDVCTASYATGGKFPARLSEEDATGIAPREGRTRTERGNAG